MLDAEALIERLGRVKGHFKTKDNRIAKLVADWPNLESKMVAFIERGRGRSETARLAYGVLTIMETGIRVGNEGSAEGWICENQIVCRKDNPEKGLKEGDVVWRHPLYGQHVQTFGLTTLLHQHVTKNCSSLSFDFVGKKLVDQSLKTEHPALVEYCPRGEPEELFLGVPYRHLAKFVKRSVGRNFTPKDLRAAKVDTLFIANFVERYAEAYAAETKLGKKRKVVREAIEETANTIGHTKSVSRSAYLSQEMIDWLLSGAED